MKKLSMLAIAFALGLGTVSNISAVTPEEQAVLTAQLRYDTAKARGMQETELNQFKVELETAKKNLAAKQPAAPVVKEATAPAAEEAVAPVEAAPAAEEATAPVEAAPATE